MPDEPKPSQQSLEQAKLDADEVAGQVAAIADHLQRSGVQWLPKPNAEAVELLLERFADRVTPADSSTDSPAEDSSEIQHRSQTKPAPRPAKSEAATTTDSAPASEQKYSGDPLPTDQRRSSLELIQEEVKVCQRCEVLASCRTNTVFGEGSPSPRIVFFGEGPGADEDRSGRPFVGRAGQLLTKMIEACTLRREDVYILNTVKCRPPGNRNPEQGELDNCRDYYQRQLAILRPEYIVCLGAIASQELLQNKLSVGRMRGRLHSYFESKVLVTYHPAYLLRTPAAKKAAWEDLQLMMRDAGLLVP